MANDGTVKIAIEAIADGFESGLKKLGGVAKAALSGVTTAVAGVSAAAGAAAAGLLALESATEEYRIAQGKLNTAFEAANLSAEAAQEAYNGFYAILGDTDTATEASQLLATLVEDEKDISKWTKISAGVFGTFGDSLPIEGLIEASNETAKVGQVTGVLADALNWAGISEDEFNKKLEACSDESERNDLIMRTLSYTYDDAANAFYRNNEALIQARENQALLDSTLAQLGETVSRVKNNLISEFLPGIAAVVSAFNDLLNGAEGADEALSAAIGNLISGLVEKLPEFLSFGVDIIQSILSGLLENLPTLLNGLAIIVGQILQAFVELAPSLVDSGINLLNSLAQGLEQSIPAFIEKLPEIISSMTAFLAEKLPEIAEAGGKILAALVDGLVDALPMLVDAFIQIMPILIDAVQEVVAAIGETLAEKIPFLSGLFENLDTVVTAAAVAFVTLKAATMAYQVASTIVKVIQALTAATQAQSIAQAVLNAVMNANPFVLIATVIATVVAAIVSLALASEDFRNGFIAVCESIGAAIQWVIDKILSLVDWFKELFGVSSSAGDKVDVPSGGKSARSAAAPVAISEGDEGGSISAYALSRSSGIAALEGAVPSARDRMISDLAAAMPAAQSRVAIATAAMAPSAGYSAPPPASYSGGNGGDRQQQPIILRPNWTMRFEDELAQFAQVFKPVIDAEDARVGQGVQ